MIRGPSVLRVNPEQLEAVAQAMVLDRFETDMVPRLRRLAPFHVRTLGVDGVRRCIRFGIERARTYGVTNPGLLQFHIELMFMFGGLFDTDPLLPWASRILRDPSIRGESERMERLYDAMHRYLGAVAGPERCFVRQALANLGGARTEDYGPGERHREQPVLDLLARIYPQRCAYLGDALLRQLIGRGAELAAQHDLPGLRGSALVTGMMFVMGHGFGADPLFPWVRRTLYDPSLRTSAQRIARLEGRAQRLRAQLLRAVD